jgi:hypothetical protein
MRAAAAIVHPNLATVADFTSHDDLEILAHEDVQGPSLDELEIGGTRLPPEEVLWHATELAAGLAAAHERGVAHGRITPANVRIGRDGRARLLDLGVPRAAAILQEFAAAEGSDAADRQRDVQSLARTIQFMLRGDVLARPMHARTHTGRLAGSILEVVGGVLGRPATAMELHDALEDVARHTHADPGYTVTASRRPAPVSPGPVAVLAATAGDAGAPLESETAPTPDRDAGPGVLLPVAAGRRRRRRADEETSAANDVMVPDARVERSTGSRAASWGREIRHRALRRLPAGPSVAQFALSAAAGAILVLIGLAIIRPDTERRALRPVATEEARAAVSPPIVPVGALRVSAQPGNARVSLNGGPWRPAPVTFVDLPVAVYQVRVTAPGYRTRTDSVAVRPGDAVRRAYDLGRLN